MRRPQFTLRALLVAMLVVGAFFGGMAWQRHSAEPVQYQSRILGNTGSGNYLRVDETTFRDGTRWFKPVTAGNETGTITFSENGVTISVQATVPQPTP